MRQYIPGRFSRILSLCDKIQTVTIFNYMMTIIEYIAQLIDINNKNVNDVTTGKISIQGMLIAGFLTGFGMGANHS